MAEGRTAWPKVEDDWFVEPVSSTAFLLEREAFEGFTWDPACGQGHVLQACLAHGLPVTGTDLRQRTTAPWFAGERDFLARGRARRGVANIITNPPYGGAKLAERFVRKAVAYPGVEKVAIFANTKFLFGAGRSAGLWSELPPDRVYPINPRPSCPPGQFLLDGGKASGGVENFIWLVWDLAAPTSRTEIILGSGGGPPNPEGRHRQTAPGDRGETMSGADPATDLRRHDTNELTPVVPLRNPTMPG